MSIYRRIYKEIKKYDNIVIARHIGPDPDALGAQFALKELIQNKFYEKKVYALGSCPVKFKFFGNLDRLDEINDDTLLIILDTPDTKRIDGIDDVKDFKHIIKIDHHPVIDNYESLSLIDETSSSTCQLILEFIFKNHLKLTKTIAEKLYMGIVSDTGRFMHDYTTIKTFELVTKLLKKSNIDFTTLYSPLYARPLSEIKFQGFIFENLEMTENGLGYIKITDEILKEYGVDAASAGNIISELNFVNELKIWLFLTEDKKNNQIRANIRSRGPIINEIASKYGGGGHKYASGARLPSWEKANELIDKLDNLIIKNN